MKKTELLQLHIIMLRSNEFICVSSETLVPERVRGERDANPQITQVDNDVLQLEAVVSMLSCNLH